MIGGSNAIIRVKYTCTHTDEGIGNPSVVTSPAALNVSRGNMIGSGTRSDVTDLKANGTANPATDSSRPGQRWNAISLINTEILPPLPQRRKSIHDPLYGPCSL